MSVVRPRSRCPKCRHGIAWYDNLPVLSWVLLRGRCRGCKGRIGLRYPLVELGTAILFGFVAAWTIPGEPFLRGELPPLASWLDFLAGALVTGALIALSLIDWDHRILPDEITKTGIVAGPVLAFLAPRFQHGAVPFAVMDTASPWAPRVHALLFGVLGAVAAGGALWLIGVIGARAFKKEAMGFGDVKMIAAMGGIIGLWSLLALAVASVLGAVVGIVHRLVTKDRYIPFGPFLAAGMWLVMWFGPSILQGWLTLFAPNGSR
jgi:leader peptidase (prepilin peptidase)/N-methyltransferase